MTDSDISAGEAWLRALAQSPCRHGAPRLSDGDIRSRLAALPGWSYASNRIEKTYSFANYYETMSFVNAVAWIAHGADHHPDLAVGYNRCTVGYSTHDAGGVTLNDCVCAARIELLRPGNL